MKIAFRRILNLLLYLSFCVMVGTGLLMAYRLIPGSRGGQGLEVLGWNRHEWGALHTWVSYGFITLVAAHLAINWAWLIKCAANGHGWRLGAGLLAGAVIIGTFLLLPITQRQGGTGKKRGLYLHVSPASEFIRISSASNESLSFQRDIYPIFEGSCFSCHGPRSKRQDFVSISAAISSAMTAKGRWFFRATAARAACSTIDKIQEASRRSLS